MARDVDDSIEQQSRSRVVIWNSLGDRRREPKSQPSYLDGQQLLVGGLIRSFPVCDNLSLRESGLAVMVVTSS